MSAFASGCAGAPVATRSAHDAAPEAQDVQRSDMHAHCTQTENLERAAAHLLNRKQLTPADLDAALRLSGASHVWPKALRVERDREGAMRALQDWLAARGGSGECGVAMRQLGAGHVEALVLSAEKPAELTPLPLTARVGQWMEVRVRVPGATSPPQAYAVAPNGQIRNLRMSDDNGSYRTRFALSSPGRFTLQLTADLGRGPRPVAEAWIFADVAPTEPEISAPSGAQDIASLITESRAAAGLGPLRRESALDRVALEHASQMARRQTLAHELEGSTPTTRLDAAHVQWERSGENVAHAATEAEAHQALLRSPSHRANILNAEYTHVGIGVSHDPKDDSVWVCEVFVRP